MEKVKIRRIKPSQCTLNVTDAVVFTVSRDDTNSSVDNFFILIHCVLAPYTTIQSIGPFLYDGVEHSLGRVVFTIFEAAGQLSTAVHIICKRGETKVLVVY